MTKDTITVPGTPAPQGSKRHVGGGRMVEMNKNLKPYRDSIIYAARDNTWHINPILVGPIPVSIIFRMPRPNSHYGTGRNAGKVKDSAPLLCSNTPDLDKIIRSVNDGITDSGLWKDDDQVAYLTAVKLYGEQAGVTVRITERETS